MCVLLCSMPAYLGFISQDNRSCAIYLLGMGGFNTGIRTFTTLGRAGGAVFRKPFSVSVSLIQGPCLGSPVTENRGELPDRLSLQHEELTFDAIET